MRTIMIRLFLFVLTILSASTISRGQVRISVLIAPPPLPVYEQPICPGQDYIWVPGYWAWDADFDDYYWVPGTWVLAPEVGLFWTPGYWAWEDGSYVFYNGYWGPQVGFYGGIVYGFGYFGYGYEGGRWENGHFFYNRSVNNVDITVIHNVYNTTVVNNTTTMTRISYNGGQGGIQARPTAPEEAAAHERHFAATAAQVQHVQAARADRQLRASQNHGRPPVAATPKPAAFRERGVVPAREGTYNRDKAKHAEAGRAIPERPANPANNAARPPVHVKDLPPVERRSTPNTGNPRVDQKYQQQQQKLAVRQEQERAKLQQQQERDHQRLEQEKASEARRQQVEQQHQRQTQQLMQRQTDQQQRQEAKQQPKPQSAHPKGPPQ